MTSPAAAARHQRPEDFHPLEVIPFFRRWRSGVLRDVLYTFIWNCGFGILFWLMGGMFRPASFNPGALLAALLFANSIGYTLHAIFLLTGTLRIDARIRRYGMAVTAAYYTVLCTLGVVIGVAIIFAAGGETWGFRWMLRPQWIASMGVSSAIISIVIAAIFFSRERQARAEAELERERLRTERIEREAAAAHLRALQAQVEPHFLFNTLANVTSLVDTQPATAKRMLESFNLFLRSSLAATRVERTNLGAEGELIGAYLDVLQVRMGERLRYAIAIAPELAGFELPSMLLQPIVENAIRHGVEPKVEGGRVSLQARRDGDQVVVEISDTGVGFAPTTRGGLGLTNVRDRLRLIYAERASLEIAENPGGGTVVTLRLPR